MKAQRVSVREVKRKLAPLILELKKEGRKNYATVNIARLTEIATELEQLLNEWQTLET